MASAAGYVRAAGRPVIAWQEAAPVLEEGEYLQVWDERQDLSGVVEAARRAVFGLLPHRPRVSIWT